MSICASCRRALLARLSTRTTSSIRYASTVPSTSNAPPSNPPQPFAIPNTPALSSIKPIESQPLSTPHVAPSSVTKSAAKDARKSRKLDGSIPGGEELRGLGYLKAKPRILAKEDDVYPDWLWTLLEEPKTAMGTPKVDLSGKYTPVPNRLCPITNLTSTAMTKKQRMKHEKKQEKLRKSMPRQIPIHEQSQDLTQPGDDAITSLERRRELTKSAREARRKGIREANFLRSM